MCMSIGVAVERWRQWLAMRRGPSGFDGLVAVFAVWLSAVAAQAAGGALEIRNGYFWDPTTARFFFPHGIAYQSWNPPVGSNQSLEQVGYDLLEFKKMGANSVR